MPNKAGPRKAAYDKAYNARSVQKKRRAARNGARRAMEREGRVRKGDGMDVDHRRPLSRGGSTGRGNLRVVSASKNRARAGTRGRTRQR